jgi:hypothetical protein
VPKKKNIPSTVGAKAIPGSCGICENCTKDACGECAKCTKSAYGASPQCFQKVSEYWPFWAT